MQSIVRVTSQILSFSFHHDSSPNLGGGSAQIARTEQLSEEDKDKSFYYTF